MINNLRAFQEVLKRNNLPTPDTYLGISELIRSLYRPDVSPNPERIREVLEELTWPVTVPAGNPITFKSCSEVLASKAIVTFAPKQDLHGQSAPYPVGGGKNKLPITVNGIKSSNSGATWSDNSCVINDVTFTILTDSDNNVIGIKANGTASSDATLIICGTTSAPAIMTFDNNMIVTSGVDNSVDTSIYSNIVWGTSPKIFKEYVNIESNYSMDGFGIRILSGKNANNIVFKPMIRLSTESDASFTPYSNICLISGYDGLTLTVSDGQSDTDYIVTFSETVYGGSYDFVSGKGTSEWGYIAEYDGETITEPWLSSIDVYVPGTTPSTGAEVVYKLATPAAIELTPEEITINKGTNVVTTDGDNVTVKFQVLK